MKEPTPELVEDFRAYLHLAITAAQTGQSKRLELLPGPKMQGYCRALAKLPGNILAAELAAPVWAILEQIEGAALDFQRPIYQGKVEDAAQRVELERVLEQLDDALAFILRRLVSLVRHRAPVTKCQDLLCEAIGSLGIGDGVEAARLIRRWQKEFPQDDRRADGAVEPESFPDFFAWDAYQRINALDKLADEFPEHIRTAARQMHAWPMLVHRHTDNRRRFQALAQRLDLGAEYPIDASEGARFRPDTPLVRYLDPLIYRLNTVRCWTEGREYDSAEQEQQVLRGYWWEWPDQSPGDEVVEILRKLRHLPPLNKVTAGQWAEKAIVPLILARDASDWKNCAEPVLHRIAKQGGVKSRATFKSRLLAAVTATLRRLARPA